LGIRSKVDLREQLSPGFKFNDWELKGVPTRIEIGPRDVENGTLVVARRDQRGREGKQSIGRDQLAAVIPELLRQIQQNLLEKATQFRDEHTSTPTNYEEFKQAINQGFARVWWAGSSADEKRIQEETKATLRCLPLEQPEGSGTCFYTGKPANQIAIFARSY
jgi:prolyl-tRNA synthetase